MKTHTSFRFPLRGKHSFQIALGLPVLAVASALALATWTVPANARDPRPPCRPAVELPSPVCDSIEVPEGARLSARFYAYGVQIYRWTGSAWQFVAPEAVLYADPGHEAQVGIHYAGPTWEANDGSKVVAARLAGCSPAPGAIPWLLLGATVTSEHGRFARVACIQRINTVGGTAPAEPGAFVGAEARVPYTAEYYFYHLSGK